MEVADHILLPHAPEEGLDEQPRDPRHDLAEADPGPLADSARAGASVLMGDSGAGVGDSPWPGLRGIVVSSGSATFTSLGS